MRTLSFLLLTFILGLTLAENGLNGWLRYAPLQTSLASHFPANFPSSIVALKSSVNSPLYTAAQELQKGFRDILQKTLI
jgi:alpha-glucuronidase